MVMMSQCVSTFGTDSMLELHVFPAQDDGAEAFLTHVALEGLCVQVDDHVSVQTTVSGEAGVTNITFISLHS